MISETGIFDDIFAFSWARCSDGYKLAEAKRQAASSVILRGADRVVRANSREITRYHPREALGLHRTFSLLARDESANEVLAFVSKYGFLGLNGRQPEDIREERIDDILEASNNINTALNFVDLNAQFVRKLERAEKGLAEEGAKLPNERSKDFVTRNAVEIFNNWQSENPTQLSLKMGSAALPNGRITAVLRLAPTTLLGSFWLAVAEEICSGQKFRSCAVCGKTFRVGDGGSRTDRTTCSDSCRQAASRNKRLIENQFGKGRTVLRKPKGKRK